MSIDAKAYKSFITQTAKNLGFTSIGFSKAEFLNNEAPKLEKWLNKNHHGKMAYMANYFDMRLNPTLLVPGAKTVISLLYNYFPKHPSSAVNGIAKYAWGNDYHEVLRPKLNKLLELIREEIGEVNGRAFVDSAPVLEKAWAVKSGLGWMGKNSNIIARNKGSFFFVAELIIDLTVEPDIPIKDYCGTCTACIDACPTEAIVAPQVVDGSKCISYYTIELKEAFENNTHTQWNDWIFGCDVCQDVCPWNRFSVAHNEPLFEPNERLFEMTKNDWLEITEDVFKQLFKKSAVKRAKYNGLKRNIDFVLNADKN